MSAAAQRTGDGAGRGWAGRVLAVVVLVTLVGAWSGLHWRVFRPPFHGFGKQIAWLLGEPEAAYNFGEVVPERVYRSSLPDRRFVEYLRDDYGVRRIVSLMGTQDVHRDAEALGLSVTAFDWSSEHLPPEGELEEVLELLATSEEPVLLHCKGGLDRTGYAAAFYRVSRDGWPVEDALDEMNRYWHRPERHEPLQREMRARLAEPRD